MLERAENAGQVEANRIRVGKASPVVDVHPKDGKGKREKEKRERGKETNVGIGPPWGLIATEHFTHQRKF